MNPGSVDHQRSLRDRPGIDSLFVDTWMLKWQEIVHSLKLSFPQEFETALYNIIYGFEQTAASFKSLVRDPELSVYVNPPASDVVYALSRDVDEEEKAKKIPWPDSELLFGQDPDYQNDVGQIFHQIKDEVDNVLNYSKVMFSWIGHVNYQLYCLNFF